MIKEIHLDSVAQQLKVKFTAYEPDTVPGQFYLLTNQDKHRAYVIRYNSAGQPLAYAETADPKTFDLQHATLVTDNSGVSVFGHRLREEVGKPLLWIERLAFK